VSSAHIPAARQRWFQSEDHAGTAGAAPTHLIIVWLNLGIIVRIGRPDAFRIRDLPSHLAYRESIIRLRVARQADDDRRGLRSGRYQTQSASHGLDA
jgi:hypothetical protein